MNATPIKPWSTAMKIALPILSAIGALVCVASVITLLNEGRAETAVIGRAVGGAMWAVIMLYIRAHPEWQRSFEEKF